MSEKEKMKSEEIAKVLAENPTAKIYLAGLAQGMKLAKSMLNQRRKEQPAVCNGHDVPGRKAEKAGRSHGTDAV